MRKAILAVLLSVLAFPVFAAGAEDEAAIIEKLKSLDLEGVMSLTVTSVSKRPQKLGDTASAVYVLTQEDIRRSGAVNIPEALRMVPGVTVTSMNQNRYEVSIRSFNGRAGVNKLLVLLDGRSVYSPVYGGVLWQQVDTVMEDIERIEVIRGPGAALWGSNAVAGVINIITKSARDTQGALLAGGGGNVERGFGSLRYGGKAGEDFDYRVYGKYRDEGPGVNTTTGGAAFDAKQNTQTGFRGEWRATAKDLVTLQGDAYDNNAQTQYQSVLDSSKFPFNASPVVNVPYWGDNVLARWERALDNGGSFKLQTWYDQTRFRALNSNEGYLDQEDVEFQHNFPLGERQNVAWGVNYRNSDLTTTPSINFPYPSIPHINNSLFGVFGHDEITLVPKTWNVIVGSKFERNNYTGWEIQPNVRTVWTPHPDHTLWAAVSRAVRIPEVATENLQSLQSVVVQPNGSLLVPRIVGNSSLKAETLVAYEAGYRINAVPSTLSFDLALFYNVYDNLADVNYNSAPVPQTVIPGAPPQAVLNIPWGNYLKGEVYGGELSAEWKPVKIWSLTGSYAYSQVWLQAKTFYVPLPGTAGSQIGLYQNEPHHFFKVRSYLELPRNVEFDTLVYYMDASTFRGIPSYTRLDLRLGWKPVKEVELSLAGQNLTQSRHIEFSSYEEVATAIPRSVFLKATLRF